MGRDRTYDVISKRYFWPGQQVDVKRWVKACVTCAKHKPHQPKHHGHLQPIQATYPFEIVAMDIVGPFKTTKRKNKYVLVCVDLFTSWVEAAPLETKEAQEVADKLISLIITRHGCPSKFLTDKGTQFTSKLFQCLCKKFNIGKLESSVLHPQTNGKAERFIRFLTNSLSLITSKDQHDWDEMLDCCLFAYRTTMHRIMQESPFFLLYGRDVILPSDIMLGLPVDCISDDTEEKFEYKANMMSQLRSSYETLVNKRETAVYDYKYKYDRCHKNIEFSEGEKVMVFWPIPKKGFSQKLLPKWEGPFTVIKQVGAVTYRVQKDDKILLVHVQRLRHYEPWNSSQQ